MLPALEQWENESRKHAEGPGAAMLNEATKKAIVAPPELATHLKLNVDRRTTYALKASPEWCVASELENEEDEARGHRPRREGAGHPLLERLEEGTRLWDPHEQDGGRNQERAHRVRLADAGKDLRQGAREQSVGGDTAVRVAWVLDDSERVSAIVNRAVPV